jgi:ribonuclease HI
MSTATNWIRRGWKTAGGSPVVNQDLWQALHELNRLHTIRWHWVRAHNGHAENERVDQLATAAMRNNGVPA